MVWENLQVQTGSNLNWTWTYGPVQGSDICLNRTIGPVPSSWKSSKNQTEPDFGNTSNSSQRCLATSYAASLTPLLQWWLSSLLWPHDDVVPFHTIYYMCVALVMQQMLANPFVLQATASLLPQMSAQFQCNTLACQPIHFVWPQWCNKSPFCSVSHFIVS